MTAYAELAVTTNFSFLRGASHPKELAAAATLLKLSAIGIADRNSLAGVVRVYSALAQSPENPRLLVGARLVFADGTPEILAYPTDRAAYGRLCRLLSLGKLRAKKGECLLYREDLLHWQEGLLLAIVPPSPLRPDASRRSTSPASGGGKRNTLSFPVYGEGGATRSGATEGGTPLEGFLKSLAVVAPQRVWLAASMLYQGDDRRRLRRLARIARASDVPLLAINDVLYHAPDRRALQDVVTCIREHVTLDAAGKRLEANAERHLKSPAEMARLFRDAPEAIEETMRFASLIGFSLDQLKYNIRASRFRGARRRRTISKISPGPELNAAIRTDCRRRCARR